MNFLQLSSHRTATVMTVAVSLVGFILLLGGAVLTGLSYTEIRPNIADENYNRYMGAHLQKTIGPVMLATGFLLLVGGCCFLGFVMFATQTHHRVRGDSKGSLRRETY